VGRSASGGRDGAVEAGAGPGAAASARAAPRRRPAGDGGEESQQVRIIRARRYAVKPMSVDEAALEVGGGDAFLVFRNATTDTVNVLFRRPTATSA
jgi:hypothetical protein